MKKLKEVPSLTIVYSKYIHYTSRHFLRANNLLRILMRCRDLAEAIGAEGRDVHVGIITKINGSESTITIKVVWLDDNFHEVIVRKLGIQPRWHVWA